MRDPIAEAIAYADLEEHEGAGYTLLIRENGGSVVEVDVYPKEHRPYLLRVRNLESKPDLPPDRADYFPGEVASVTILW